MAHGYFKVTGKPLMMLATVRSVSSMPHGCLQRVVRSRSCHPRQRQPPRCLDASLRGYQPSTLLKTLMHSFVISRSGTTRRYPSNTLLIVSCASGRWRRLRPMGRLQSPLMPACRSSLSTFIFEKADEYHRFVPTSPPQGEIGAVREAARLSGKCRKAFDRR